MSVQKGSSNSLAVFGGLVLVLLGFISIFGSVVEMKQLDVVISFVGNTPQIQDQYNGLEALCVMGIVMIFLGIALCGVAQKKRVEVMK